MRKHDFFFGLVRIPLDALIVMVAFWCAKTIRINTDLIPGIQLPTHAIESGYVWGIALVSFVILGTIFAFQKLYSMDHTMSSIEESFLVIKSGFVAFFIVIGLIYLTNGFPYQTILIPRLILVYAFSISTISIVLMRIGMRYIRHLGRRRGLLPQRRVLLVMSQSEPLLEKLLSQTEDIDIVGYLAPCEQTSEFAYLGTLQGHAKNIPSDIEEVAILSHDLPYESRKILFEYCQIRGIRYRYVGNLYETHKNNTRIDFIGQIPFIEIRSIGITPWGRVIKRLFDVVLSTSLLIILLPVIALISLTIMLDSPGSPVYQSKRVGRLGQTFWMYKFRSMKKNAEQEKALIMDKNERINGPLFKLTKDPRVTKIGHFLRKWSIDEIPQIWNVFLGTMSFIGPRPHLPEEVAQYSEKQRQVLTIKPGITGMAQVYGRDKNSFDREVELDLFYIENWSLLLDTKILLLTFRAVFQGR